jgi:4-hydroxy-3-methylbut-2-enyl diphosphate reductase
MMEKSGFCLGVRRAINLLEKVALERGGVETLGAVVHNQQVLQRLSEIGVKVVNNIDDIRGDIVVTSSHGVSPDLKDRIRTRCIDVISTTCPFVRRAQVAARRLAVFSAGPGGRAWLPLRKSL